MDAELVSRMRRVIGRLSRELNTTTTAEGLTPSQASVLGLVAVRGPLGLGELAKLEGLNPTMLSRVVRKLDERGLIERLTDPDDQRAARVRVTTTGEDTHTRVARQRNEVVSECLDRLPEQAVDQLVTALPALESLAVELTHRE